MQGGRVVQYSLIQKKTPTSKELPQPQNDQSDERFRLLANSIPQMAWIADRNGRITWYNQRWREYTGIETYTAVSKGWRDLCHRDHIERVIDHFDSCIENGEIWEDTFPLLGKNGEYRWFLSRACPVYAENGLITNWFGTNTDITGRMEAEELLLDKQQRQDEIITTMRHDMEALLESIISAGNKLEKSASLNNAQQEYLQTIQESSKSMRLLINNLPGPEKTANGDGTTENISFNLRELVEEVAVMMRVRATEKKLPLDLDYDSRLDNNYIGNQQRLKQIILGLVSNAVKFTERGGVKIIVGLTSKSHKTANIAVHVVDTGIGISNNKKQSIFESPLKNGHAYRHNGIPNLANSKNSALLMGGDITFESREGFGSEFTLRLPLTPAQEVD